MLQEKDLEPDLWPFDFYMSAFMDLSTCRNSGMALGAIPFTAIVEYSRLYDVGDFEDFSALIRRLDSCFLKEMADRDKKKPQSRGKNAAK